MVQAKSNAASPKDDVQQLSEQIAALKHDLSDISHTIAQLGASSRDAASQQVRGAAGHLREKGERGLRSAQQQAEELGHQASDAVRNQPGLAVGVAVAIGFLLGFMSGRR
jgi:ElaB/YqjD/DUF883 family membrane-anchored ribosome-binding protein